MITSIENLPGNIVGFDFSGKVTAEQYEKIVFPEIKNHLKNEHKLDLICHFNSDVKFELGAIWDDALIGLKNLRSWNKIAFVSDISWLDNTVKVFGALLPVTVKIFPESDWQTALKWISMTDLDSAEIKNN